MEKIRILLRKEWAEVYKNRMVLFSIIFLPLLFTAIPLIMLSTMQGVAGSESFSEQLPPQMSGLCTADLSPGECFQVYMVSSFLLMFMMTPMIIPVNIAAYSIVGEKTTRSLEPLLATPITTLELLAGKNLAAVIPAVGATWIGFLLFAVGAALLSTPRVAAAFLNPLWLLAIFLVGPLLAVLSVNFGLMVSSRVNEPRTAEQISAVIVLPLLLLFFGQMTGYIILNRALILFLAALLLIIDAGMIYLAVNLFERENILTRWK